MEVKTARLSDAETKSWLGTDWGHQLALLIIGLSVMELEMEVEMAMK